MSISKRTAGIHPSLTLSINARAAAMSREGKRVLNFGAGEPDFDTPGHIKAATERMLQAGQTKYTANRGLPELCNAIAEKLRRDNGLSYGSDCVIVSNGAKQSIFNAILALCGDGEEVIIPSPYWLSYPEMVTVAGGKPVFAVAREENDFKCTPEDIEAVVTNASRVLILNSPGNPTGVAYSADELRGLAGVAVRRGLYIISDEIYEKMIYDGLPHASVGALSPEIFERTITVNGFSKAYAMTGWRLGYCAGPKEVVQAMDSLQSHSTSAPNTFAQYGALEALRGPQDCIVNMVSAFAERRERMFGHLSRIKKIRCVKPGGAFYMFPNTSACGLDSLTFAERLLVQEQVAVVPGVAFGADGNVRFSYACGMDTIEEGMKRLERFVSSL